MKRKRRILSCTVRSLVMVRNQLASAIQISKLECSFPAQRARSFQAAGIRGEFRSFGRRSAEPLSNFAQPLRPPRTYRIDRLPSYYRICVFWPAVHACTKCIGDMKYKQGCNACTKLASVHPWAESLENSGQLAITRETPIVPWPTVDLVQSNYEASARSSFYRKWLAWRGRRRSGLFLFDRAFVRNVRDKIGCLERFKCGSCFQGILVDALGRSNDRDLIQIWIVGCANLDFNFVNFGVISVSLSINVCLQRM